MDAGPVTDHDDTTEPHLSVSASSSVTDAAAPSRPPASMGAKNSIQREVSGEAFANWATGEYLRGTMELRPSPDGEGGAMFLIERSSGRICAVFKPSSAEMGAANNPKGHTEEEDVRQGFSVGTCYKREVLAYKLDHNGFAGVPETVLTTLGDFGEGSLQRFVPGMMQSWSTTPKGLDAQSLRRIAIFDIRTLNSDRNGGNLLVPKGCSRDGNSAVVPIDHAYCLPEGWADPDFEWVLWTQSTTPFDAEELRYIEALDADTDASTVREELGDDAADVIFATTMLLKIAAPRGYTARQIAEFCRRQRLVDPCGLEEALANCRTDFDQGGHLDPEQLAATFDEAFPATHVVQT